MKGNALFMDQIEIETEQNKQNNWLLSLIIYYSRQRVLLPKKKQVFVNITKKRQITCYRCTRCEMPTARCVS